MLCTPAQASAMAAQKLEAWDADEVELPDRVAPDDRARDLSRLAELGAVVRGNGTVELPLDLEAARHLIAKLRASRHHHERVGAYVARGYKDAP